MPEITYQHPSAIVWGDWLEANLNDPDLRVFDCTFHLVYEEGTDRPYHQVSGRSDYEAGHIPGAGFLDLQADFSVADAPHLFTLPSPEQLAGAFERSGVGNGTRVVLYSRNSMQCATRFWWMLRWLGFDSAAILDGGLDKWIRDGRPLSKDKCTYTPGQLTINLRPKLFVGVDAVRSAIGSNRIINALEPDLHSGETLRYARAGRIPGSVNVPATALLDAKSKEFVAPEVAAEAFKAAGIEPGETAIHYCGGGIKATLTAFILHQLGHPDIAVYDGSMSEWASEATLPMERD
jgi:thiosulfate/3-mercaptopyruvate sulfurtransferase